MQLREFTQRVQSMYSKGVHSNSTRLTSRHIYSAGMSARSLLLRQRVNKNQKISQWSYQVLPCVELIKAPIHECECIPDGGCVILRSKYKLPKPIVSLEKELIKSVTSFDGSITFDIDEFETVKYSAGNKFTSKKPTYYFRNGYLYITTLKILKALTITILANDFLEAYNFPSMCPCDGCDCNDIMDLDFPIDGDLERPLIQLANEELIIMFKQMTEDKSNNAADDTDTSTKSRTNIPYGSQDQP